MDGQITLALPIVVVPTYLICNNSFVRGLSDLMQKRISNAISVIRENKAWQEHRDYLIKLNN